MKECSLEKQIHYNCYNYCKETTTPLIEIKRFNKGQIVQLNNKFNKIVVHLEGQVRYSLGKDINKPLSAGAIILFPSYHNCTVEVLENVTVVNFILNTDLSFCDHFSFEMLYREKTQKKNKANDFYILEINPAIKDYINLLMNYLEAGLYCGYLLEIKLREFLYIVRYYYPNNELKEFFSPILSDDFMFSTLVRKSYHPKISVGDLAKKTHYSISGFEKRFNKVFNMTPHTWIKSQRSREIYHELSCSSKTFSELGYEFGFSSPSHFHNFCKQVFQDTPGNIRKKI